VYSLRASREAATASSSRAVPAVSLAEHRKCLAEIALCHGPVERHALAGQFVEGVAIGGDRLLQQCRPALTVAELHERSTEIVLGRGPMEGHALAGSFREGVVIQSSGRCARGASKRAPRLTLTASVSGVVAEFIALVIQLVRLAQHEFPLLLLINPGNETRRFTVFYCCTPVSELEMINPSLLSEKIRFIAS
jgi:hypothetical protein